MTRTKILSPREQITAHFRSRIDRGTIPDGARIDTRRTLAEQWDVSVGTVMSAFTELANEGYVRAEAHRHGGTFAIGPQSRQTTKAG